jgi:Zn-dependent protease
MYYQIERSGRDEPNVDCLAACRAAPPHRPDAVDPAYPSYQQNLASLGFQPAGWYLLNDELHGEVAYLATFMHSSGVALARVWRRLAVGTNTAGEPAQTSFLSQLVNGDFLLSTSQFSDLAAAPGTITNQLVGAGTDELWESHVRKLAADPAWEPLRIRDPDQAADILERYHARVRDSYLADGIFRVVDAEQAIPVAAVVEAAGDTEQPAAYAPILAEIQRLQDKRPAWGNAILILVFSLLVFFGAGAAVWSWRLVVMLLPILLFHELGHYVAMRTFGYRNLRMFFIPLFGAAVSGRHYNVPGWKKVVDSLAGPLPGIALGVVLGIAALFVQQRWLLEFSLLLLVLNGFNLLPFLPLDGGWVAHALVFSRHPALDAGFRVVAAVALIGGGLALGTRILPLIGVFMLFGVPMAFRIARVAVNVRRSGIGAQAAADSIPPETACRIIDALRVAIPSGLTVKHAAQTTLQVFENANARPPGWLASLGLGSLHAGSFVVSLLFPLLLLAAHQSGGLGLFRGPPDMPHRPPAVEQIENLEVPAAAEDIDQIEGFEDR